MTMVRQRLLRTPVSVTSGEDPVDDHVHRRVERELLPRRAAGGRYFTLVSRSGEVCMFFVAAPFGQRRPREIGLAGSPSTCVTSPFST